ncbi:hypothetical protein [uncultured Parabacteroides sp.]|uniref:hypothetical protein n=1 Tax=uncultured Parabacteroides sp. TaxID=512312 RepID=UPI00262C886F|nr:hypothetical protein [uncultured Parabacteroides sp.]
MNKRVFKLDELSLPLEDLILEDDELRLVKGGMGVTSINGNCNCNCDCNCGCSTNGNCDCKCGCGGVTTA